MAQQAPDITRPPYETPMYLNGSLSVQWSQWFALVLATIADLQARVKALGG